MCMINTLFGRMRHLASTAGDWLRDAAIRRRVAQEFAQLDARETDRVLADIGCTRDDLRAVIENAAWAPDLLKRMTARLGLTAAFAATDPQIMREIERRCTTCAETRRCRRFLADATANDTTAEFCPNAGNFAVMKEAVMRRTAYRAGSIGAWR